MESNKEYQYHRPRFMVAGVIIVLIGVFLLLGAFMVGRRVNRPFIAAESRFGAVGGSGMMLPGRGMGAQLHGHMLLGAVSAINGSTITVHNSAADTTVTIQSSTSFYKAGAVAKQTDLKVGDVVSVQGRPDANGVVQATSVIIR